MAKIYITDKSPLVLGVVDDWPAMIPEDISDDGKGHIACITIKDFELPIWNKQWKQLMSVDSGVSYVYFVGKKRFKELVKNEKHNSNNNDLNV